MVKSGCIKIGRAYQHDKSKKIVLTQSFLKHKTGGAWVDSVLYTEHGVDHYSRVIEDFESRFTLVVR